METRTVAFHTLGCKLNFAETSTIARLFVEKGFVRKNFSDPADVYVINTCSVTENADRECRSIVRNVRALNPEAFVAVVGCYAQLKPHEIASIEGVDVVLGATEKFRLLNYVDLSGKSEHAKVHHCDIADAGFFVGSYSIADRTRSFLKVQDGCDYSCTFCTIPLARGKSRSDTIENVLKTAQKIADTGVKEIVLTGVNLGDFGYGVLIDPDTRKSRQFNFLDLVKSLDVNVRGIQRFRISSIEPNLLKDEVISFVAESRSFAPHFHIPLQSGSNAILGLMKRRYQKELYVDRVKKIKTLMPQCCIGVDVIVGFPGETEELFMETYDFLRDLDISYLHVFTYSERDNTPAAQMAGVVPVHERKRRNKMLRILSAKKLRAFYETQKNCELTVLFEEDNKDGFISGYTQNYVRVRMPYDERLRNKTVPVMLSSINEEGTMDCEPVSEEAFT